jgi:hypothetical protein
MRFNDSGTAKVSGVLNYELTSTVEQIKEMHSQYLTAEAVEKQLIRSFLQMAVFNTGGLVSSTESYSSSRGYMIELIQKQLVDGIYATDGTLTREKDGLGFERAITKIQIRKDKETGSYVVSTPSPFKKFGIIVQSLNINGIKYDEKYLPDSNQIYCAELIYYIFKEVNQQQDIFKMQPMTFKDPETKELFPGWINYYRNYFQMEVPEGKMGINPGLLINDKRLTVFRLK